jgi:hypothetical protein
VRTILQENTHTSGDIVGQHLVGAKLEERHPGIPILNQHGRADTASTPYRGFQVGTTCFHVTLNPGLSLLKRAVANLEAGLFPVLLVPNTQVSKTRHLAEAQGIDARIGVFAIEDFVAQNIIEMSKGQQQSFVETMKSIIEKYNRRLEEVETDLSLKIELQ